MSYKIETHCPNCFEDSRVPVCQQCGFKRSDYSENSVHLPLFTVIGKHYTVGRILGTGGFAVVYIAKKVGERQLFAVKEYYPEDLAFRARGSYTVKPKTNADTQKWFEVCYRRFVDEARLLENCQKYPVIPGIVRYTDLIEQNDTAYLVMEYVSGCSLDDVRSQTQTLSSAQVKSWLKPLLDTLEALHRRSIYHRDISPKNILLRGGPALLNDPVLMDFGLARLGVRESQVHSSVIGVGTPEYMAPEQTLQNAETGIDGRTDLFSLGAVLYHCVNGAPAPSIKDRKVSAKLAFNGNVDPVLKKAIESCLALSKNARPDDVAALKRQLAPFFNSGGTIVVEPDTWQRNQDHSLWQQARRADNVKGYQAYLENCVSCEQKDAAQEALKRLKLQAELDKKYSNTRSASRIILEWGKILLFSGSGVVAGWIIASDQISDSERGRQTTLKKVQRKLDAAEQERDNAAEEMRQTRRQLEKAEQDRRKAEAAVRQTEQQLEKSDHIRAETEAAARQTQQQLEDSEQAKSEAETALQQARERLVESQHAADEKDTAIQQMQQQLQASEQVKQAAELATQEAQQALADAKQTHAESEAVSQQTLAACESDRVNAQAAMQQAQQERAVIETARQQEEAAKQQALDDLAEMKAKTQHASTTLRANVVRSLGGTREVKWQLQGIYYQAQVSINDNNGNGLLQVSHFDGLIQATVVIQEDLSLQYDGDKKYYLLASNPRVINFYADVGNYYYPDRFRLDVEANGTAKIIEMCQRTGCVAVLD